jgi:iron-sulfur cluster repair protein YtfE (RIC family)
MPIARPFAFRGGRSSATMKVTLFLRNEHENLKSLFNKYKKPSTRNSNGKRELFNDIRREILVHSQMEIEIFYPALSGTSSTTAADLVSAAIAEHHAIEKELQEIGGTGPSDHAFETKVDKLIDDVLRHIETEEEEIFNEARTNLPEYRLEELGLEMEDRRKILTQLAA